MQVRPDRVTSQTGTDPAVEGSNRDAHAEIVQHLSRVSRHLACGGSMRRLQCAHLREEHTDCMDYSRADLLCQALLQPPGHGRDRSPPRPPPPPPPGWVHI